jgi:hypothetical protein
MFEEVNTPVAPACDGSNFTYTPRCSTCQDLSCLKWHNHLLRHYIDIHVKLSQLQKSAEDGCKACGVIRSGFEHFTKGLSGLEEDHDLHITNWDKAGMIRDDVLILRTYYHPLSLVFHVERGEYIPILRCLFVQQLTCFPRSAVAVGCHRSIIMVA